MKAEGVIVPLITPFYKNTIDTESLTRLLDILTKYGITGAFPVSTTGEGPLLSNDEKLLLVRKTLEYLGNVKILAGTASARIDETIMLAETYKDLGVDAVIVVEPYYYPYTRELLKEYFHMVLSQIDHPVIIYSIPSHTGNPIDPSLLLELSTEYSNLIGVKVTTSDFGRILDFINVSKMTNGKIGVLVGNHDLFFLSLSLGASGGILGVANLMPKYAVAVYENYMENSYNLAVEAQSKLTMSTQFLKHGFTCVLKHALYYMDVIRSPESRVLCSGHARTASKELIEQHRDLLL